jgi:ketosteroid isomerase-like protein
MVSGRIRVLLSVTGLLAACPAPTPSSEAARREPPAPRPAEPAEVAPPPAIAPRPAPPVAAIEPAAEALPLPPALAAEGVRPVVRSLWRALEAVDAGDAAALAGAMTEDGRWFPPGSDQESVQGPADLQRAMGPWSSAELALDIRRIVDPGDGPFAAQVTVASLENPVLRYELVLLVEPRGDRIAAVRHFGDPLGPVRVGPNEEEPLALGPLGEPVLERGASEPALVDVARALTTALDGVEDEAARARLAEDVVLHDVAARRTRRGREGYLAGMRETLGPTGHLAVDRHLAGSGFVVLEGAVYGREASSAAKAEGEATTPQEHGFVDVHRVVDGLIAETWHYVNRRGRPPRPRLRP